jgi:hypothetical protein
VGLGNDNYNNINNVNANNQFNNNGRARGIAQSQKAWARDTFSYENIQASFRATHQH